jgi:uncharacterized protein (DUF433 family)
MQTLSIKLPDETLQRNEPQKPFLMPLESILMMKNQILNFYDGRITIDPSICNGKPTIRGKRITVHTILEFLGAGDAEADILQQYPSLEPEDIRACQRFAAELMNRRYDLAKVA